MENRAKRQEVLGMPQSKGIQDASGQFRGISEAMMLNAMTRSARCQDCIGAEQPSYNARPGFRPPPALTRSTQATQDLPAAVPGDVTLGG